MATREEHAKKLAKKRVEDTKQKVISGINLCIMSRDPLTNTNISKHSGVHMNTLTGEVYKNIINSYKQLHN